MKKPSIRIYGFAVALAMWPFGPTAAEPRCYPSSRFVVLSGGTVRDTLTKLVWKLQPLPAKVSGVDAVGYCSSAGFRLPTVKELSSLVDLTVTSGATIDQIAFPNTPTEDFWTSSTYVYSGGGGGSVATWIVEFSSGSLGWNLPTSHLAWARCVR